MLLGLLAIAHHAHAGVSSVLTPASTTLVRQATSITHPSSLAYSQPTSITHPSSLAYSQPLAFSYSAPLAYSYTPTYYSSPLVAPFQIPVGLFDHGPIFQIPNLIGQNPIAPPQSSGEAPAQGEFE